MIRRRRVLLGSHAKGYWRRLKAQSLRPVTFTDVARREGCVSCGPYRLPGEFSLFRQTMRCWRGSIIGGPLLIVARDTAAEPVGHKPASQLASLPAIILTLAWRYPSTQLIEEVQQKDDVLGSGRVGSGSEKGDALVINGYVKPLRDVLLRRPKAGGTWNELASGRVACGQDPFARSVKQLVSLTRPQWGSSTAMRNQPFSVHCGECPDVDLIVPRFVGLVGDPPSIRRDRCTSFIKRGTQDRYRLAGFGSSACGSPRGSAHKSRLVVGSD